MIINNKENKCLKHFNDSKSFIKYSNNMVDSYKKFEDITKIKNGKYCSLLMR